MSNEDQTTSALDDEAVDGSRDASVEHEPRASDDNAAELKKKPLFKRRGFQISVIAIVIIVAVLGTLYYLHARQFQSTDDAFVDAHVVRLQPQISGQLTFVADADNMHVKAGQLLAKIRPSTPQAQLREAQAGVAEADAGIAQAVGKLEAAQAQVQQAQADALAPAAQARQAARDYARYQNLHATDAAAVAATQIDAARAQAQSTAAQANAAQQSVQTARANVKVAQKAIEAARAQRKAAQARVSLTQVSVGDSAVTAPISGQVVNRSVNVGSTVSPQTQLMAIIPETIWVTANFKETQIAGMKQGQPVDIRIDAFPGIRFHGHIDSFQRGSGSAFSILPPQNATGNYVKVVQRVPVRIAFDRNDGGADWTKYPLGPGMSVVPTVKVR